MNKSEHLKESFAFASIRRSIFKIYFFLIKILKKDIFIRK